MSVAQGLRLDLRQTQSLVLTPQLQQAIRLLQMSNFELASVVDREVAENPFLDHVERATPSRVNGTAAPPATASPRAESGAADDGWAQPRAERPADLSLRLRRSASRAFDTDAAPLEARLTRPKGLQEHLRDQLHTSLRDPKLRAVAGALVEWLDEDGYLREPDLALAERLGVSVELVAAARRALQGCEPVGIGAGDLGECLALQLRDRDRLDPAMSALLANLTLLAKADFAELMRRCGVDAEDLQEMIAELKRLDPKPGHAFAADEPVTVIPDIFIYPAADGRWRVELNGATLPRVLVDNAYHAELCHHPIDREAKDYLSERLQSANWLAKALDQRARTVLRVAKAIFARQLAFLEGGAARLRPLVLRDIAEATGLHESTVSRATAEKYVATPQGTFPLKYFFTTAIAGTSGEEAHSAEAIRLMIKRLIDRESPTDVLSDDQIVDELRGRGIALARRTVAKYRESLSIPSSVQRRRAKALGR